MSRLITEEIPVFNVVLLLFDKVGVTIRQPAVFVYCNCNHMQFHQREKCLCINRRDHQHLTENKWILQRDGGSIDEGSKFNTVCHCTLSSKYCWRWPSLLPPMSERGSMCRGVKTKSRVVKTKSSTISSMIVMNLCDCDCDKREFEDSSWCNQFVNSSRVYLLLLLPRARQQRWGNIDLDVQVLNRSWIYESRFRLFKEFCRLMQWCNVVKV